MPMLKLTPLQKSFLKAFITKLLILPAFWFFFKAVYPLFKWPWIDPVIYIMLTMFDWLLLLLTLFAATVLDLIITNIGIRRFLSIIKPKRGTHTTASTADKSEPKEPKKKKDSVY